MPVSGNIDNISIRIDSDVGTGPGAGGANTYTVRVNGVTAIPDLSCTITDTAGIDVTCTNTTIGTLSVSAGDRISIKLTETTGTPGQKSTIVSFTLRST